MKPTTEMVNTHYHYIDILSLYALKITKTLKSVNVTPATYTGPLKAFLLKREL